MSLINFIIQHQLNRLNSITFYDYFINRYQRPNIKRLQDWSVDVKFSIFCHLAVTFEKNDIIVNFNQGWCDSSDNAIQTFVIIVSKQCCCSLFLNAIIYGRFWGNCL